MEKLINNEWVVCEELEIGDTYRVQKSNGCIEVKQHYIEPKENTERVWRDIELQRTDSMTQPDRPDYQSIMDYREALRNYPQLPGFPNVERPTLS